MEFDRVQFIRERNEALLSLDKGNILSFCRKYGIYHPHTELEFWKSVHKARIAIRGVPEAEKEISRKWLIQHGVKPDENTERAADGMGK